MATEKPKAKRKAKPVDDGTITWERPSGTTLTTSNDPAVIEYAESQGWKRK